MTGEHNDDRELGAYLQGKDGLSREYHKGSSESPPAHVDAAILAASRKAVGSKPLRAIAPFSSRWHVPVSIAAIVVLSVLLVFNIPDDTALVPIKPDVDVQTRVLGESFDLDLMDSNVPSENAVLLKEEVSQERESARLPATQQPGRQAPPSAAADRPTTTTEEVRAEMPLFSPGIVPTPSAGVRSNEADDAEYRRRLIQNAEPESKVMADTMQSMAVEETSVDALAGNLEQSQEATSITLCTMPRPEACTEEFMPVCAVRDTGIRCVTTPCDSTESIEYSNACSACSDVDVISYTLGRCE